jgi:hypothetical protein
MVMGYAHRHLFHSKNICPLLFGTCFIQKIYAPLLFLTKYMPPSSSVRKRRGHIFFE